MPFFVPHYLLLSLFHLFSPFLSLSLFFPSLFPSQSKSLIRLQQTCFSSLCISDGAWSFARAQNCNCVTPLHAGCRFFTAQIRTGPNNGLTEVHDGTPPPCDKPHCNTAAAALSQSSYVLCVCVCVCCTARRNSNARKANVFSWMRASQPMEECFCTNCVTCVSGNLWEFIPSLLLFRYEDVLQKVLYSFWGEDDIDIGERRFEQRAT